MMNLFNLIPFWQLDGSRMMEPVSIHLATAGTVLLLAVVGVSSVRAAHVNPLALGVAGGSAWKVGTRWWEARRGATRAFGPGSPELPAACYEVGQPVFIPGSMVPLAVLKG
jgi:hypothetical protein